MARRYNTRLADREAELFRGRDRELEIVREALAQPLERTRRRVLLFTGVGGVGKSAFARQVARELRKAHAEVQGWVAMPPAAFAGINLAEELATENITSSLLQLRLQLGLTLADARFPIFDCAFARIHAERYPSSGIGSQYGMLNPDGAIVRRAQQWLPTWNRGKGVKKGGFDWTINSINQLVEDTPLINTAWKMSNRVAHELGRKLDERENKLIGEIDNRDPDQIEDWLPRCLGADLLNAMAATVAPRPIAIICDSIEFFHRDKPHQGGVDAFDREGWLRELVWRSPGVVFVMCGREPLNWADHERSRQRRWEEIVEEHPLGELADEEMRDILDAFPVPQKDVAATMIAGAAGLPFYLGLQLDIYADLLEEDIAPVAVDFAEKPALVLSRFRDHVGPTVENALRTLAHARLFDRRLFKYLKREHLHLLGDALFSQVVRYSFVQQGQGLEMTGLEGGAEQVSESYRFHQHYQELQRKELGREDPEHQKEIDAALFAYWDSHAQPNDPKMVTVGHETALREAWFHLLAHDQSRFGTWVLNRWRIFYDAAKYRLAQELWEAARPLEEAAKGPDHPDVATTLNCLAGLHRNQGRYDEARPLYERALAIGEKALGPDHPYVATTLNDLAELHGDQGRYDEARPLCERALAIREKALGPDHPFVATSLNNLAGLHFHQGRYDEAGPLYERALAVYEKALGPDHPSVANPLNNLAWLHRHQGRYDEARPLYERALAIGEKALGPDHPSVATILNNLAGLHGDQGRFDEARPLCERALAIGEKALGPDHPSVANPLNNLAGLHHHQGRYDEARPLYERALAVYEKAQGPDHPSVATILNDLAGLHGDQGRYDKARPLCERALAIREKALGPDHPFVATTLNNLAWLHHDEGRYDEARPLYERALAIREKALGPDHPSVATTLSNLARLHGDQGRYDEARPLCERALAIREKALGPDHPSVATTLSNLARLHGDQGRYDEARPLYERALDIREKALGPDHPSVATTLNNLAGLHGKKIGSA